MSRVLFPISSLLGVVAGIIVDWVGILILVQIMSDPLTEAEATLYKAIFTLIALGGIVTAAAVSAKLASWWSQPLAASLLLALFLCGLAYGFLARPVSLMNDCHVGLAWPVSAVNCD